MDPRLVGTLEIDPALPAFSPEMPASDMLYGAAACNCGGTSFRVSGWPRIALAPGGFLVVGPADGIYDLLGDLEKQSIFLYKKPL